MRMATKPNTFATALLGLKEKSAKVKNLSRAVRPGSHWGHRRNRNRIGGTFKPSHV